MLTLHNPDDAYNRKAAGSGTMTLGKATGHKG